MAWTDTLMNAAVAAHDLSDISLPIELYDNLIVAFLYFRFRFSFGNHFQYACSHLFCIFQFHHYGRPVLIV